MIEYLHYQNVAANAVIDMMRDAISGESQTRFVNRPSKVTMAIVASAAAAAEFEVFAGNRTIVHRSALEGGGTDGVFPNLDQKAFSFLAAAGEKLSVPVRETAAAGTVDVMLVISVEPIA
jgi:hypothetical protein